MVDISPETPAKAPGFFVTIINGDEMAFVALLITFGGLAVLLCFIGLTIYTAVWLKQHFSASDFCDSAAVLLGALASTIGALAGLMGVKAKLGG